MKRLSKGLLAVGVLVLFAGEADAGKKPKLKVAVAGKHFKANIRPSITGEYSSAGFFITGVARHGRRVQNLIVTCAVPNIATATLPATATCGGGYADTKVSLHGTVIKAWAGDQGITAVVTAFADGRITGTFTGSLPAGDTNPNDPPAELAKGVFSMPLVNSGF